MQSHSSIAQQEIERSINLNFNWGKFEIRDAMRELLERIVYREAREASSDYLRGYLDGINSKEEHGTV